MQQIPLAVCFTHSSVCTSLLLSRFVPPLLPSPCPSVCYLHLRLYFCPTNRLICTIFLDPCICVIISYLFFSLWCTSLYMTDSRCLHMLLFLQLSLLLAWLLSPMLDCFLWNSPTKYFFCKYSPYCFTFLPHRKPLSTKEQVFSKKKQKMAVKHVKNT